VSAADAHAGVGRLLSLNVGRPREVEWQDKTVRTAIWKTGVDGPRMVRTINIDGDDQADRAGHGGEHRAVFVYQIDSYRYWERELGRDDFVYGQFGENFTVEGLADDEVRIGDRYRIGNARFEVTQPRVTCFRLGIRMDEPEMPSLVVAHHRPGFYLRVLTEGEVQAGESIVLEARGPQPLTVADIDALLYLPKRSPRRLRQALRIPALSEGWKGSFRTLLTESEAPSTARPPAWPGFMPLTVTAIRRESTSVLSLTLSPPSGAAPTDGITAGQYLTVRLRPNRPEQPPLIRSYSLSAIPKATGYRISVKHEPNGAASSYIHGRIKVGDTIDAAAPRGSFTLRVNENDGRPIVLASAGVGATPVLAMLSALAAAGSTREIWWLHGARNHAEHAFADEVDRLLASLPNTHRLVSFSHPDPARAPDGEFDAAGRLSVETITAAGVPLDADFYLCGPESFMRSLSAALTALGAPADRVAMETFGAVTSTIAIPGLSAEHPPPHPPPGPAGDGPEVTFSRSGLTVAWDPSFSSLLELAEACDVPVSFGCRIGVCHYCESGLLSGSVTYTTEPLERPDTEHVLVCCSQPTAGLILEL
jgi:ferredoxin-NADP reductase/MOSC domain-containing protein YiiM